MWYLVLRHDVRPRSAWAATLDEHLAWMHDRHAAGDVLFSGPSSDIRTGIYIIRARSREDAERIAADDPFTRSGDCRFDMHEWDVRQALGIGAFTAAGLDVLGKPWRSAWQGDAGGKGGDTPADPGTTAAT